MVLNDDACSAFLRDRSMLSRRDVDFANLDPSKLVGCDSGSDERIVMSGKIVIQGPKPG